MTAALLSKTHASFGSINIVIYDFTTSGFAFVNGHDPRRTAWTARR